jgi:hypothetical protein
MVTVGFEPTRAISPADLKSASLDQLGQVTYICQELNPEPLLGRQGVNHTTNARSEGFGVLLCFIVEENLLPRSNSPTGIRTRAYAVKARYPNQLDYRRGAHGESRSRDLGLIRPML